MAKVATTITIDSDIKKQAQELLADFGLDLSTAVNIFLRQTVRENAIPFEITKNLPNEKSAENLSSSAEITNGFRSDCVLIEDRKIF